MSTITNISITGNQLIINYKGPVVSKYRGVNFSAYDNGNLSNSGQGGAPNYAPHGLCTDTTPNNGSVGGWLDNSDVVTSPKPNAYGGDNFPPAFTVGKSFGYLHKGSPLNNLTRINNQQGSTDYGWSTSYPSPAQITNAIDHGINIIRMPFMPAFMDNIATGWAKGNNDIYKKPNKDYLNYYMTSFDLALKLIKTKNNGVIIMDNHSYQRWCPTNEPGTFSCLEPAGNGGPGPVPSRRYSMDETTDKMCPYKLSVKGVAAFKGYGLKAEWGHNDYSYIKGNDPSTVALTKENVSNNFCLHATSSENNSSQSPTSHEYALDPEGCKGTTKSDNACYGGPTKRIIGIDCMPVLWYNILESEFSLIDKDGNPTPSGTVGKYLTENQDNIWIDIMNEPNEVNNRDIGTAIAKTIKMFRKYGIRNKLMIEGNYWSGAHAQICPYGEKAEIDNKTITRPDGSSEGWYYTDEDPKGCAAITKGNKYKGAPIQIIHEEITNENPDKGLLGDIVYNVHQYMDKNSTGGHNCVGCNDNGVTTLKQMQFVTGFDKLNDWAEFNDVQLFASEFGAPIGCNSTCAGCNQKLNLFIEMLEKYDTVLGWTIWRAPPTTTWVSYQTKASQIPDPYKTPCAGNSRARIGERWIMGSTTGNGLLGDTINCIGNQEGNGCGNFTYPWTNSMIFADKAGNLNKGNLTVLLNTDCQCNGWQSIYDNNKGMTDKDSSTFCMPRLWALNGASSKGQDALTNCEIFAKG